jgi:hypothetical protein
MNDTLTPKAMPAPTYEYDFHPLAEMFPLIEGEEFKALVKDVAVRGIINPIILHQGKILDGRNRWRAAKEAKYPLTDRDFKQLAGGLDPEAFVISANMHRRQLSSKQKRDFIAKQIDSKPKASDRDIAKFCCVDHKTVASVREEMANRLAKFIASFDALSPAHRQEFIAERLAK